MFGQTPGHEIETHAGQVHFTIGGAPGKMRYNHTCAFRPTMIEISMAWPGSVATPPNIQWFACPAVTTDIERIRELDLNTIRACASGITKHLGLRPSPMPIPNANVKHNSDRHADRFV